MDYVVLVVSNIKVGFGRRSWSMLVLVPNIKGGFNSVLPKKLSDDLRDLGVPARLRNIVSYLIRAVASFHRMTGNLGFVE